LGDSKTNRKRVIFRIQRYQEVVLRWSVPAGICVGKQLRETAKLGFFDIVFVFDFF
jgi:hypothetical protein